MTGTLAIARVTLAEARRSKVALGLGLALGLALAGLAVSVAGDGTEAGKTRAFLAGSLDATWVLLALGAVFLATGSLARELEDGRAIPIQATPVSPLAVLVGKWLGLGLLLGGALAASLAATALGVALRQRAAPPDEAERIGREILVARATARPPRLEVTPPTGGPVSLETLEAALKEPAADTEVVLRRARERLVALLRANRLPKNLGAEEALRRLVQEEVVRALSVTRGRRTSWVVGPIAPREGPASIALRYRYSVQPYPPGGRGPLGIFTLSSPTAKLAEWRIAGSPNAVHELPVPDEALRAPELRSPIGGKVSRVGRDPEGALELEVAGKVFRFPRTFEALVAAGATVTPGEPLARSPVVFLEVAYENADPDASVIIFPPEGVSIVYRDRPFLLNLLAAFGLLFGRVLFLLGVGLALTTLLDGKVAALTTFFVLAVAAGHEFLAEAVGPIRASASDRVFGVLDAPLKTLLHGVLFVLPDLGQHDASESLAQGLTVEGAGESLLGLAALGGGVAILVGAFQLGRRELAGGSP